MNGTVEGAVEASGDVEIDDMAKVKASVAGREVSIRGQVSGPVTARKRLVVARSGSLIGDVRVPRLVVEEGATFKGNVSMGPPAEMAPKAAELAKIAPTAAEPSLWRFRASPGLYLSLPLMVTRLSLTGWS